MSNGKKVRRKPAPDAAPPQQEGGTPYKIDPERILEKLNQDNFGATLIQSAMQQCVIEDQHAALAEQQKVIEQLQNELIAKNGQPEGEG